MLALTDSQLARLCIGATALAPEDRCRWLRDIAERLDPPPRRVLRDLPKAKGGDIGGAAPANAPKPLADYGIDRRLADRAREARWRARHDGESVFRHACKMGLEGIVSKRLGSRYRSGRSTDWLKFKNPEAPAVKREAEEEWG